MIRLKNVLKASLQDVLKMSRRRLENVFKTSWRHLQDAWWRRICWSWLKTSWKCLEEAFPRTLEDVLNTFWRRLEDVLKRLEDVWPRQICWSWSRRLEAVLKTYSEDREKELLQDVFIKRNVCWVYCFKEGKNQIPEFCCWGSYWFYEWGCEYSHVNDFLIMTYSKSSNEKKQPAL